MASAANLADRCSLIHLNHVMSEQESIVLLIPAAHLGRRLPCRPRISMLQERAAFFRYGK